MKARFLLIFSALLLVSCLLETSYTITPKSDAIVLKDLEGEFKDISNDSNRLEIKLNADKKDYLFLFYDSKDSLTSKQQGFMSKVKGNDFLNLNGKNQLKNKEGNYLYQYFKIKRLADDKFQFNPVVDSLFKGRNFSTAKEFRDYFIKQLNNPVLFGQEKNSIVIQKLD